MALIGTLRTKMTKVVIGIVAIALGAFILGGDFFGNSPTALFGGNDNTIGEIGEDKISIEEFQAVVQERENNYILNFGRQPGERELTLLRQQAWELLIARHAISPQYEKVGVTITSDEIWDLIQGKNVDENIKLSFTDSSGNFDRNRLIQYLQSIDNMPPTAEARIRWDIFKADLAPARERIKYENLIVKTGYVTAAQAEQQYHLDNDVAEIRYLYVPYFALRDSLAKVTDTNLKSYYDQNREKYKTEETRSLSYVTFPVVPSTGDSLAIREELTKIATDFRMTSDDSTFATVNSDGRNAFTKYNVASLPTFLNNQKASLAQGLIIGPFLDGTAYKVVKIVKIQKDTIYQMKASHILIKWDDPSAASKKAAKDNARKILREIKAGADFGVKAREFGTDGTASKGGDLGWFQTGQMVKPFETAVANATKPGLLNDVVETDFGYHIILVTNLKDNTTYSVATIEREITPGDDTQNEAFRKADAFATDLSGVEEFRERAKEENLPVSDALDLATSGQRIGNLGEARQVITWLFREAEIGEVSEVFDLEDNYAVAVMTGETEKGYKSLEKIKDVITPLVVNVVKAKLIIEKLNGEGSLEDLAKSFPGDAVVNSMSDLKMNTAAIPNIGYDPEAIGKAFSLDGGKRSKPFGGEHGVVIVEMLNKTVAPAIGDYSIFKSQLLQNTNTNNGTSLVEAIKQTSEIVDMRYKFY